MAAEATTTDGVTAKQTPDEAPEALRTHCYNFWFYRRMAAGKFAKGGNYEDMLEHIGTFDTVQKFWDIYSHMLRPSELPSVNLSVFRKGIKPLWEDKANKKGGQFVIRVHKGLSSHCWEALLLAMVGNQFGVGADEIAGCSLSIRATEDIISLWNRTAENQATVQHIKQRLRDILQMPVHLPLNYKPHFGEGNAFDMSPSLSGRSPVVNTGVLPGASLVRHGDRSPVFRTAGRPGHGLGMQTGGVLGGWRGSGAGRGAGGLGGRQFVGGGSGGSRDAHASWHPGAKHPHHHNHHHAQGHNNQRGGFERDAMGASAAAGGGTMKWPRGRTTSEGRESNEGGLSRGGRVPVRPWNASGEQSHLGNNSLGGIGKDQSLTGARWGNTQVGGSSGSGWGRPRGNSFNARTM